MKRITIVLAASVVMQLVACDKLQQQGTLPTYESATLDTARSISGSQSEAPSTAASGASAK
jgi:hypothetical protein